MTNNLVRENPTFRDDRLQPEALKHLYLSLLKEEHRDRLDSQNGRSADGTDAEHPPRKRKLSSSPVSYENTEHEQKLGDLVRRLYARFRAHVVAEIREDERKIQNIQKEIGEIEGGEWDARLQQQAHDLQRSASESRTYPMNQTSQSGEQSPLRPYTALHSPNNVPTSLHSRQGSSSSAPLQSPSPYLQHTTTGSILPRPERFTAPVYQDGHGHRDPSTNIQGLQETAPGMSRPYRSDSMSMSQSGNSPQIQHQRFPSGSELPPTSGVPGASIPPVARSPDRPPSQPGMYLPPPQQSGPGYRLSSPMPAYHSRSPQLGQTTPNAPRPPMASGLNNFQANSNSARPPISPVILPPVPGMNFAPGSPARPLDARSDNIGQPFWNKQSQPQPHQSPRQGNQVHSQSPHQYYQQLPYPQQSSNFGQFPPNTSLPYSSHIQGRTLPLLSNQESWQHGRGSSVQTIASPHQAPAQFVNNTAQRPQLHTPAPRPTPMLVDQQELPKQPPREMYLPSTAKWKAPEAPAGMPLPPPASRPEMEGIDPMEELIPPEELKVVIPKASKLKKSRKSQSEIQTPTSNKATSLGVEAEGKIGHPSKTPSRAPAKSRRGRRGSTASAMTTRSTRSQSIASHAGDIAARKIKHEQPSTPANFDVPGESADEDSRQAIHARSPSKDVGSPGTGKRKRGARESSEYSSFVASPFFRNDNSQILCARNFPRISQPIMNEITAHKHASMFAKPLTNREAPGYKDLIYRPQDLKSIKSAIYAGSRAIAATSGTVSTPQGDAGSPGRGAATPTKTSSLWMAKALDIIPPKGIVNSSQLEKELMRMFANAVMFNLDPKRGFGPAFRNKPDDDDNEEAAVPNNDYQMDEGGVIKDTREMFEVVERSVTEWRAAERTAEMASGRFPEFHAPSEKGDDASEAADETPQPPKE